MNNDNENNSLSDSDARKEETDQSSVDRGEKRILWFTASELAGHGSFPTSDRWTRDHLKDLTAGKEHLCRKRRGTKAMEYHISLLPTDTQRSLLSDNSDRASKAPQSYSSTPSVSDFLDEFALIPGYRVQVSAGHGSLNPDQLDPVRHLAFRRKWLKFRGFDEHELAIVWAKGDSMEPTIHSNDTLVVHLGRKSPADGHIYIFRDGDKLFVKRYQSILGAWRLISDNSFYPAVDIPKNDQHNFEVIGQVVHIAKDVGD